MVKNWALVIGINHYDFLQPLKYAQRDAELMQNLLDNEIGFERVFLFADDSPNLGGELTHPHRPNLLRFLQQLFAHPFLEPEDNFWFFFSGYGMIHADQDYLMPADGNPDDIENTGISLQYLIKCLRSSGCNCILMLDACRHHRQQPGAGFGQQTQQLARQTGVISILSSSPGESSSEIDALQQGVFTHAIREGLGIQGQCATVKRLYQYLCFRVPELLAHYKYPLQTPDISAEPVAKLQRVIVDKYANLHEISDRQINSLPVKLTHSQELAQLEQLWIRTNTVTLGSESYVAHDNFASQPAVYVSGVNVITEPQYQSKATIWAPVIDDVSSEPGINYQRLSQLLAAGDWKAADGETVTLMLKLAKREKAGWLDIEAINKFPCTDLCIIDQLWVKYSKGRFGFSVQKQIWESLDSQADADYQTWSKFGDRIGWRINDHWLFYSDLNFVDNPPVGHFPAAANVDLLNVHQGWVVGLFGCLVGFSALTSRLAHCQ